MRHIHNWHVSIEDGDGWTFGHPIHRVYCTGCPAQSTGASDLSEYRALSWPVTDNRTTTAVV
jgi:hypothetical protein